MNRSTVTSECFRSVPQRSATEPQAITPSIEEVRER